MQISDAASCFKGVKENPSNDFRITVSTKTDMYSVRVVRVILKSGRRLVLCCDMLHGYGVLFIFCFRESFRESL